ncbi:DUF5666 domain-containing protein [Roseococcus sp. DSY-14]|uniref:DUF5666 domain-containing protein n=1 Tax=Roseococcus sp. DSY-14 TaxID=3369650 RepID=UPI00387AC0DA
MSRLLLLALLALAACGRAPAPTPAATCRLGPEDGPPAELLAAEGERGIGGTGMLAEAEGERGIGGTGIWGVLTGFGSLCLQGQRVALPPGTPILLDGRPVGLAALRGGQVLAVEAAGGEGALRARRVTIRFEASGPVEAVGSTTLRVAGQAVALTPETRGRRDWRPGEGVRVSGLRRADGTIAATRLDPLPAPDQVSSYGTLRRGPGGWMLGSMPLRLPPGLVPPPEGAAIATGRLRDGVLLVETLRADLLTRDPPAWFGRGVERFVLSGAGSWGAGPVGAGAWPALGGGAGHPPGSFRGGPAGGLGGAPPGGFGGAPPGGFGGAPPGGFGGGPPGGMPRGGAR